MKKKNLEIIQEEASDCGICCLLSILRYYKGNASKEELRISSKTNIDGVNAYNLIECAREYGLNAKAFKTDKIKDIGLPFIVHYKINESLSHFMVVYKVHNDYVEVMDPSIGFRKIALVDFYKNYTGVIIQFYNSNVLETKLNNTLFQKIKKIIINNMFLILLVLSLNVIMSLLSIINSFFISFIKDSYTIKIFLFINLFTIIIYYIINKLIIKLKNNINQEFLKDLLFHVFKLPLKYIHVKDNGEILKRVNDSDNFTNIIFDFYLVLVLNSISLIIFSIFIFIKSLQIFMILIVITIIYILISIYYSKIINYNLNIVIKDDMEYYSNLCNYIKSMDTIIYNSSNDYYYNKLFNYLIASLHSKQTYNKKINVVNTANKMIILIMTFMIITYSFLYNYDYKDLLIILFLNNLYLDSLIQINSIIPSFLYIRKLYLKINDFYNIVPNKSGIPFVNGDININKLSFGYNKLLLKNINLSIKQGEKIVITGKSGVGKSTLCKILIKDIEDYKGSIKYNNVDIRKINKKDIFNNIKYISQDEKIITGTIRENILMGRNIDNNSLNNILSLLKLDVINNKCFGLDTYLYGGGDELSGGEKQRIILARSLVMNPSILIMDESLSEVDDYTEKSIIKSLFKKYNNTTIIYISHNSSINYNAKIFNM